jgi:Tfp pilus assembly protein PilX
MSMRRATPAGALSSVLARLKRDDGIALVLTLIVMGLLTITTIAVVTAMNSNEQAFGRDRQTNRALNVAEAALNAGLSAVKALPATATTLSPASGTVDQGSWSYTAARTQDTTNPDLYYWTVTATGLSPDGKVTRIVSQRVSETITHNSQTQTVTTPASAVYGYGLYLGSANQTCDSATSGPNVFGASFQLTSDAYVKGDLCVSGGGSPIFAQPGQNLYIGGYYRTKGNSSPIGTQSAKLSSVTIVKGCYAGGNKYPVSVSCSQTPNGSTPVNCSSNGGGGSGCGSGVWATTHPSTQADVPKPTIDLNWYTNAAPGPVTGCGTGSTYPSGWTAAQFKSRVLDSDATRNTSVGTVSLLELVNRSGSGQAANSFDCKSYDSNGSLIGELRWDYPAGGCGGSPGASGYDLVITGTVFIDGNLSIANCDYAVYAGVGTLYVNGTVSFASSGKICAKPISGSPCLGNYDTTQNNLEIVAVNAGNVTPAVSFSGDETFEGIMFANGLVQGGNSGKVNGSVIADTATFSGAAKLKPASNPPPGGPGAASTTTTTTTGPDTAAWAAVPGPWQQLR